MVDNKRGILARYALALIRWRWFPQHEIVRKRDAQLLIPPLLFGLYLAQRSGKKISKAEACDLMGVDRSTTGPKFIRILKAEGLIEIERHLEIDRRKRFLAPTAKLVRLVESELDRLGRSYAYLAGRRACREVRSSFSARTPKPSDLLLPIDWPPDTVGTRFGP